MTGTRHSRGGGNPGRPASCLAFALITGLLLGCATAHAPDARRSGFDEMSPATQAMQRDDSANPAMLWVRDGEQLWARAEGPSPRSCAGCHGEAKTMRGVAARYPAWDDALRRPVNLGTRINLCRERHQGLPQRPAENASLLGLEAFVALQSRGMPITPADDARLLPHRASGEKLFAERIGQLALSCAQCHDERAGGRLAASLIPQGHATGYPLYRLEWQSLGSLGRRIRNCMTGVRADPLPHGSVEMAELELYLAMRAKGMPLETPAVRP